MALTFIVDQGGAGDFLSIQAAVDSGLVSPGDTIVINSGTYNESVSVTKALNFEGDTSGGPVIVTPLAGSEFAVVGDLGAANTLSFDNIEFRDAPRSGIEFGAGDTVGTLQVTNSTFEANETNGIEVVDGAGLSNIIVTDSSFTGNGSPSGSSGDGDILLFQYNGDALLKDLTIIGQDRGTGAAENGIQFRSDTGSIGDVVIQDVTISGIYEKQPIAIFNYDDVDGLRMKDITITADSLVFNTSINFDGIGGDIDFGSSNQFKNIDVSGAGPDDIVALQGDGGENFLRGGNEDNFLRGFGDDDVLIGRHGNDVLSGGEGNDILDGGRDTDTALYAGNRDEFDIGVKADHSGFVTRFKSTDDTMPGVNGDEGFDKLSSIEVLQFGDVALDLSDLVQLFDTSGVLVGTFDNVKDAVLAASADYKIVIGKGVVNLADSGDANPAQIVIDKDLTIVGQGQGKSVIQAVADTSSGGDGRGMFLVDVGVTLDVADLTIDGNGHLIWQAFRHNGSGTFDDVEFTDIKFNESGPNYAGTAIAVFGGGAGQNVDVTDSTFSDIGRIGVLYFGPDVTGTFEDNTYTGKGEGDFLDYALDISNGAIIEVDDNRISNNLGVASVDGSTSAGILVSTFFGAGTEATIGDNKLINNTAGVAVGFDENDTSTVTFESGNLIKGGDYGVRVVGNGTVDDIALIKGSGATVEWFGGDDANTITGGKRDDDLNGGGGDDTIDGGKGDDTLTGDSGNDMLTGGKGRDIFVFKVDGEDDTVTDFKNGKDLLDVSDFPLITNIADFVSVTAVGGDVVIDINGVDSITLSGVTLAQIDDADFIF